MTAGQELGWVEGRQRVGVGRPRQAGTGCAVALLSLPFPSARHAAARLPALPYCSAAHASLLDRPPLLLTSVSFPHFLISFPQEVVDEPDTLVFVLIDEVESLTAARCAPCPACLAAAAAGACTPRPACVHALGAWCAAAVPGLPLVPWLGVDPESPSAAPPLRCAPACRCSKGAVAGSEPADAIRAVNALLTRLDQLKAAPNVMVGRLGLLGRRGAVGFRLLALLCCAVLYC